MKTLFTLLALLPITASAGIRHYAASVEGSEWQLDEPSRLTCTLRHKIPGYGEALFYSQASKQLNMEFELDMLVLPDAYDVAAVYSVPPQWMPGAMQKTIATMPVRKQYTGDLPKVPAWTMLTELEKGFWPTVQYQDWYNPYDKVAVALNAANFTPVYRQFVGCVSNLLPYSFEDIAYSVLTYQKNTAELTKAARKKIEMIGEYLKEDAELELVLVDGYTDSYGGSGTNYNLSVKRAQTIKQYFIEMGVESDRIAVTGHGERRHIAPNDNEMTRAQNRRVVVKMSRD